MDHKYKKNIKEFFFGKVEKDVAPPCLLMKNCITWCQSMVTLCLFSNPIISHFFRDICFSKLQTQHIKRLETNIVETICKLELIFPPSFFNSIEHLPINLLYEVKVGGLVQYRWMYSFERLEITYAI